MQTVFFVLGTIVFLLAIIAIPVLTIRALALMARLDDTRRHLAELIAEASLSLEHANRTLVRAQESIERLRHVTERIDKLLPLLKPAAAAGDLMAGVRRLFGGRTHDAPNPNEGDER